jgi:uncharacterized coiled-coil protein SlyX
MLESAVAIAIAVSTGLGVFASRLNTRVNQIELRVAERYIPREEVSLILTRFEDHMIRIENKLDNLLRSE